jgi:hypothetical protein
MMLNSAEVAHGCNDTQNGMVVGLRDDIVLRMLAHM